MATLTGRKISDTYKDLLQVSNSNDGVDGTLRDVEDGEGTASVLQISSSAINISSVGALQYGGTAITSTAAELNILDGVTATTAELNYLDGADANINTLTLPASTTISAFGATIIDDADASAARTTLGVDVAGTDNSTDVTLVTTSHDYLSLSGQAITLGQIDISDDTNLVGGDGLALTGDTLSVNVDDSSIEINSDTLRVKALGVTNAMLAGSIANAKLSNSSVSYGGVSVSLGSSDATPAFDLSDATSLPIVAGTTGTLSVARGGTGATTASGARTNLNVDVAGTDNSTDVTLVTTSHDYLSLSGQAVTLGTIDIGDDTNLVGGTGITLTGDTLSTTDSEIVHDDLSGFVANEHIDHSTVSISAGSGLSGGGDLTSTRTLSIDSSVVTLSGTQTLSNKSISGTANTISNVHIVDDTINTLTIARGGTGGTTSAEARSNLNVDVAGTDNSTDVTLANTNYLSISGQEITGGTVPIGSGGTGATTASAARTALGVDPAGTDNSTDVTLAGTLDYITIVGQTITRNAINLTTDVTGTLPVSQGGTGQTSLDNFITLGTMTVGNYAASVAGTTNEIEVTGSAGEGTAFTIGLPADVVISNSLTVNGTTTTIDTQNLIVEDPLIKLAKTNNAADSVDIGFYGLYDTTGSQDLYAGLFRDANDSGKFKLFKDLQVEPTTTVNVAGTGYTVGTLVSDLEGNVTGNVTGNAGTATKLATARDITLTGDITGVTPGAGFDGSADVSIDATIAANAVEGSMLNTNVISGQTNMTGDVADADELMISDAGTLKRIDFSVFRDAIFNDVSGDATVASGGALTIAANSVALGTDTTGNYVGTVTGGSGIDSTGATSGEGIAHTLSVSAAQTSITSIYNTGLKLGYGSSDAHIDFSTDNEIHMEINGSPEFKVLANGISINQGDKIFLDGGGDTYIQDDSGDTMRFVVGNRNMIEMIEDDSQDMVVIGNGSTDVDFIVEDDAGVAVLTVDSSTSKTTLHSLDVTNALTAGSFELTTLKVANIQYTDGDAAITIANGGGVTLANGLTVDSGAVAFNGGLDMNENNISNVAHLGVDKIFGDADTDTQINFDGSDVMTFDTGNAEAMRIDASQNVGIGTVSPGAYLHTEGASNGTESYAKFSTGSAAGDQILTIKSSSSRNHMALQVNTGAGATDDLALNPDGGNVGIGTASPSASLHINTTDDGSVYFTRDGLYPWSIEHDTGQLYLYNRTISKSVIEFEHSGPVVINEQGHSTVDLRVEGDTDPYLLFTDASTDRVGIGTGSPLTTLDVQGQSLFQGSTTPSYRGASVGAVTINNNSADSTVDFTQGLVFTDNTNNQGAWTQAGIVSVGSSDYNGNLVFGTDGDSTRNTSGITERMRIDSSGNVGIGNQSPGYKLDVTGNVRFTSDLRNEARLLNSVGSAASPSYSFFSQGNAGMYRSGDGVGFSAAGSSVYDINSTRMYINTNVGIGGDTPQSKLMVVTSAETSIPSAGADSTFFTIGDVSSGTAQYGTMMGTLNNGNGYIQQQRFDGTATTYNLLLQPNGGNVGIGTVSPAGKLMVREDIAGSPARIIVSNSGTVQSGTSSRLSFYEGTSEKSYIERRRDGTGKTAFVTPADDNPFVWENATGEFMRFTNSNVGIGETSPEAKLHIKNASAGTFTASNSQLLVENNTTVRLTLLSPAANGCKIEFGDINDQDVGMINYDHSNNHMQFFTNALEAVRIDSSQDAHFDQDVIAFSTTPSDIRLKENFTKIENGLDIVTQLEGHTFNWKKGGDRLSAGFKAQEVEKILPHLVDEKKLPLKADDDKEYKILRYEEMIPYLVEAIKEQQQQINELKEKLNG